ncbi:MAG: MBG domain-containing protein, partial [Eubacterium sp.]
MDGNHQKVDDMTARLTIKKLDVNMSGVSFLNKTVVYNGQPEALQLGGAVPSGVTDVFITYQKTGELSPVTTPPTEVGDYTVTANFTVDISHNPVAPMTAVLSITQRDVVMTGISFSNKTVTYNGQPQTLAITGDLPEGMTGVHYSYQKDDGSPASATAPTMAGSYTVTASFDINANYHAVNAKTAVLLINQKEPDMGSISFGDRTVAYDGMQKPVTITGTLPEGVTGVVYTYLKSDAATILTEIPSTVGNYIVTASFMADPNYKVPESKTAHLNITKAAVDMSGIHLDNKTIDYDGQPKHIAITGNQPVGVMGITYTYQKDGLGQASIDPPTEAGTYLVTAVFAVDDNYVVPAPMTAQLVIGKLPVDLTGFTVNGLTVDYDGKPHYLVPSGALPAGMTMVTYSYLKEGELTATENPPIAAGVYAVTINFSVDGNHQSIAPITATLTINKATIDLSGVGFADQSVTYDGSPHGLLLTGTLPSGI